MITNRVVSARRKWPLAFLPCAALGASAAENPDPQHSDPAQQVSSPLVDVVRDATERFKDVKVAMKAGYAAGPCVSGPNGGAMGIHFIDARLLEAFELDARRPEALIYEPLPDGSLRLVGVEYITLAPEWDAANEGPPTLEGHLLNFVGSPNRYGLPAFYELHVWAWQDNPDGTFADWNPEVSCDAQPLGAAPGGH